MSQPKAVILYIEATHSICGACNTWALPMEASHLAVSGYDQHKGCGATYEYVSTSDQSQEGEEGARRLRPDLPFVTFAQALRLETRGASS